MLLSIAKEDHRNLEVGKGILVSKRIMEYEGDCPIVDWPLSDVWSVILSISRSIYLEYSHIETKSSGGIWVGAWTWSSLKNRSGVLLVDRCVCSKDVELFWCPETFSEPRLQLDLVYTILCTQYWRIGYLTVSTAVAGGWVPDCIDCRSSPPAFQNLPY